MNQQLNWKCFIVYYAGIVFGTILCLWLPESFQRQLAIFRLFSEDTLMQEYSFGRLLMLYFPQRMLVLGVLLMVSMLPGRLVRNLVAGYAGILLAVSMSVLTLFYSQFGILCLFGTMFPQGLCYGFVLYQLVWNPEKFVGKQQLWFRCLLVFIWTGGILLEAGIQQRLLRWMILFLPRG